MELVSFVGADAERTSSLSHTIVPVDHKRDTKTNEVILSIKLFTPNN